MTVKTVAPRQPPGEAKPDAASEGATGNRGNAPQGPQVLAFTFDLSLTADDLGKMSADQIAALFEAVGKVLAIKAAIT